MVQTISGNDFVRRRRIGEDVSAIRAGCRWRRSDLIARGNALQCQRVSEATMFSTMRSVSAEIVKKGFTSSADRMIDPSAT